MLKALSKLSLLEGLALLTAGSVLSRLSIALMDGFTERDVARLVLMLMVLAGFEVALGARRGES